MNSPSYYTMTTITLALSIDTAIMDIEVECSYTFYPTSQLDEYSPIEPAHVSLACAQLIVGKGRKVNIFSMLREEDSIIKTIESTLLEIELNNQE